MSHDLRRKTNEIKKEKTFNKKKKENKKKKKEKTSLVASTVRFWM